MQGEHPPHELLPLIVRIVEVAAGDQVQARRQLHRADAVAAVDDGRVLPVGTDVIRASVRAGGQLPGSILRGLPGRRQRQQLATQQPTGSGFGRDHGLAAVGYGGDHAMLVDTQPRPPGLAINAADHSRDTRLDFGGLTRSTEKLLPVRGNQNGGTSSGLVEDGHHTHSDFDWVTDPQPVSPPETPVGLEVRVFFNHLVYWLQPERGTPPES